MHTTIVLWVLLTLVVAGCSKRAREDSPPLDLSRGTRLFTLGLRTEGLSDTNITAQLQTFARQHSLPAQGQIEGKGWPRLTFGFGEAPSYKTAYLMVGLGSASNEARFQLSYNGTNDTYFDALCLGLRQEVESSFPGRVLWTKDD